MWEDESNEKLVNGLTGKPVLSHASKVLHWERNYYIDNGQPDQFGETYKSAFSVIWNDKESQKMAMVEHRKYMAEFSSFNPDTEIHYEDRRFHFHKKLTMKTDTKMPDKKQSDEFYEHKRLIIQAKADEEKSKADAKASKMTWVETMFKTLLFSMLTEDDDDGDIYIKCKKTRYW